jgi:hypothetical protein
LLDWASVNSDEGVGSANSTILANADIRGFSNNALSRTVAFLTLPTNWWLIVAIDPGGLKDTSYVRRLAVLIISHLLFAAVGHSQRQSNSMSVVGGVHRADWKTKIISTADQTGFVSDFQSQTRFRGPDALLDGASEVQ